MRLNDFVEEKEDGAHPVHEQRPDHVLNDDMRHEFAVIHRGPRPDNVLVECLDDEFVVIHGASNPNQIVGNALIMEVKMLTKIIKAFRIDPAKPIVGKGRRLKDIDYSKHIVFIDDVLVEVRTPIDMLL